MRILHVIAGAQHGGAETFMADAVEALAGEGVPQTAVMRDGPRVARLRDAGVDVRLAPFGRWWPRTTAKAIALAVAAGAPDLRQHWMQRAGQFADPASYHRNVGWYGGYYDARRFAHCRWHVGVTYDIAGHIRASGIAPDRIETVHTFSGLGEGAAPASRSQEDTPEDAPLLLALARLHPSKALDVLLKAMKTLPACWLWIAGEGPLRRELEDLAINLGVAERVRFLGWRSDRAALLAASDIVVFPSRHEPFGTVTIEAWEAQRPIVAAAAQGPRAYIRDGVDGLLTPIDDVAALAAAISRLQADAPLRARMVMAARQRWEAEFSRPAFVKAQLAFYEKVLAEAG